MVERASNITEKRRLTTAACIFNSISVACEGALYCIERCLGGFMARVLVLFAHPGQKHSKVNIELFKAGKSLDGITFVDLYAQYPRFNIDVDLEQERLQAHDVIVFQFPIYWYSTPSLLKEWQDLVLEYGFAYGTGGDKLKGKLFVPVVTAGGPEVGYNEQGFHNFPLRTLLSPLEQTANLCEMPFVPPLVLYGALRATDEGRTKEHIDAYKKLLTALRDDTFDLGAARKLDVLSDAKINDVIEG